MRIAASVNLIRAINFFLGIIVKKQWNFFLRGIDRDIIKSSKKVYYEQYQLREEGGRGRRRETGSSKRA